MMEVLSCGRRFRTFNMFDEANCGVMHIKTGTSINLGRRSASLVSGMPPKATTGAMHRQWSGVPRRNFPAVIQEMRCYHPVGTPRQIWAECLHLFARLDDVCGIPRMGSGVQRAMSQRLAG